MTTHSSIPAWKIPWTEEPGGLHSPWGRRELDTTEHTPHTHTNTHPVLEAPLLKRLSFPLSMVLPSFKKILWLCMWTFVSGLSILFHWSIYLSFCPYHSVFITVSLVQFSHSVMSNSLQPHESQHARPPCPSPSPGVHPNSCPSSQWWHPAISSSVVPFSSCPQSLPASGSFPVSQLFTWGGQSIGVSASTSVLPMNV